MSSGKCSSSIRAADTFRRHRFERAASICPGEMAFEPDIGPAARAVGFVDAALESVEGAIRINLGGLGLAQKLAQVQEMLLIGAAFGEIGAFPFVNKLLRGHGRIIGEEGRVV
jgi:hypothetical protein